MTKEHQPALDGLRAFAAFAVMLFHFDMARMPGGYLGVDIFFVLSGYLITTILLKEQEARGRIDYAAFLERRARRLFPALALLLAIYLLLAPLLSPVLAERKWADIGTAALYLTNIRHTFWPVNTPLSHTWSLGIEQQFYLLWPLLLMSLARRDRTTMLKILAMAWVTLTLARAAAFVYLPSSPAAYYFTLLHSTGLILGAMLAIGLPRLPRLGMPALLLLVGLCTLCSYPSYPWAIPLAEVLTLLIIASPPAFLGLAPLRGLGTISYGAYLWHIPLQWMVSGHFLVLIALANALGFCSYWLVERWFLRPTGRSIALHTPSPVRA